MRKLVWFTVPFAVAAAVFAYCPSLIIAFPAAALAALLGALLLRKQPKQRGRLLIAAAGLLTGALFCTLYGRLFLQPVRELDGQTRELSAIVNDYPLDTKYGCRVDTTVELDGRRARALLYLSAEEKDLVPGDRLTLTAALRRADRDRDGDSMLYYQSKGILLIGSAKGKVTVRRPDSVPLSRWPATFSGLLRERIRDCMPQDAAGMIQALFTGNRYGMPYSQRSDLTMAGLSHTVAISGMHVSILLGILAFLTRKRWVLTLVIGLPVVLLFVFTTGCSPSVLRAAVMQTIFLAAPLARRETDAPTALCAAMLLLLLQNPYVIANVSFQLSFAAMAGILLLTPRVFARLTRSRTVKRWLTVREQKDAGFRRVLLFFRRAIVGFMCACTATTVGAMLFTTPICAVAFGSFSLYGPLSNLLALWVIPVCFAGGIVMLAASCVWLPFGAFFGTLLALPVRYVLWIARGVSLLPFAVVPVRDVYVAFWLVGACLAVLAAMLSGRWKLPAIGILCTLVLALTLTRLDAKPREFKITALDVGQGQCVCMLLPDCSLMYDCGGSNGDEAGQHAAEYLLTAGVRRLDALVISHYDEDHVGGVRQLMYRIRIGTIYAPAGWEENENRQMLETLAAETGTALCYVDSEQTLRFSGGSLSILPPISSAYENAGSLSILFSCGDYDMLATGDMDTYAENVLLRSRLLPDVELFIAGHHGSKNSSSMALLSTILPETVIVSVGQNSYGHPTKEALARFAVVGAEVYRTDENGDITIGR